MTNQEDVKFNTTIKIAHWNINGLNAMLNKQSFLDFIKNGDYDIICFNETKLSYERLHEMNFHKHAIWSEAYNQYYSLSVLKKGYSGVAIFSKVKAISIKNGLGMKIFDQQGRCLVAEFENFYVISIYNPHAGGDLSGLGD